jgi:hypothetical protein
MALILVKKDKKAGNHIWIDTDDMCQNDYSEYCDLEKKAHKAKTNKERFECYDKMNEILRRVFNG